MEREVAQSVNLSVKLLAIAALLSIVMFTVSIGNTFKSDIVEEAVHINGSLETGQLSTLSVGGMKVMPKVSMYYILYNEHMAISSFKYNNIEYKILSDGYWTPKDSSNGKTKYATLADIIKKDGLGGKVGVDITKLDSNNYTLVMKDVKDIKEGK